MHRENELLNRISSWPPHYVDQHQDSPPAFGDVVFR